MAFTNNKKKRWVLIIILFILVVCFAVITCAEENRTLIVTWDQYENPEGIGIRLYQSREPGKYNFSKEHAIADVSADINEITICIDLDTYNFVGIAYKRDNSSIVSSPSNEITIPNAFPPASPKIKKKSLLEGCGL